MPDITVLGINHIGLAPRDPARAKWFLSEALGLPHLGDELVVEQKTNTAMYGSFSDRSAPTTAAPNRLEILEGHDGEGPIASYIEKKGGGIHHLAVSVNDVEAAIKHLLSLKVRMVDETPKRGAHGTKVAFVHPQSTGGLLIELVQEAK